MTSNKTKEGKKKYKYDTDLSYGANVMLAGVEETSPYFKGGDAGNTATFHHATPLKHKPAITIPTVLTQEELTHNHLIAEIVERLAGSTLAKGKQISDIVDFIEKEIEMAKKDMLKKATDYLWGLPWDDEDIKDFKSQMES